MLPLYEWIDYWHNPGLIIKGDCKFASVRNRHTPASSKDTLWPSPKSDRKCLGEIMRDLIQQDRHRENIRIV